MPRFTLLGLPSSVSILITVLLVTVAAIVVTGLMRGALHRALDRRGVDKSGSISVLTQLGQYVLVTLALVITLQSVGVNLVALVTAGAFFAAALGFALQNVTANFVAGLVLLFERTIRPGDVLEVDGTVVRVTRVGLRASIVRTRDEEDLIVPNATLVQNTVKSITLRDNIFRVRTSVGVAYASDLDLTYRVLTIAARGVPGRVPSMEPRVLLSEFGNSSVDFEVSIWTRDPWGARVARSDLNFAIWHALKSASITIAFPQLDVHFDRGPESGAEAGAPLPSAARPRGSDAPADRA